MSEICKCGGFCEKCRKNNPIAWERISSILNPKCECGDVLHYVTDGHYNFTNEDYELYVCHGCGKWKTTIRQGEEHE